MKKAAIKTTIFYPLVLTCFLVLISGSTLKAQWVTIPDTNFAAYLNINYPSCMNGNLMDTTCNDVVNDIHIDCGNMGISDLTGIQYFDNLEQLYCDKNQLISLPTLPQPLLRLYCQSNQLQSLPTLPPALISINCSYNSLAQLIPLPNNLTEIRCYNNQLTSLPILPTSLLILYCSNNQIGSLPTLPSNLTTLSCSSNPLNSLPTLPASLIYLSCNNNGLSNLPQLPPNLEDLRCYQNGLSSLPQLPVTLTYLSCEQNQLTSLPVLPQSLTYLSCYVNQLTSLPQLPPNLTDLHCFQNQITSLPLLPSTLIDLVCGNNFIPNIPTLPPLLRILDCRYNNLDSLPSLPQSLDQLLCQYNNLNELPELPDSLRYLQINGNTNLTCLPRLKFIETFYWSGTNVSCLPNYGTIITASPPVGSFPLCGLFNNNGCLVFWNISGKTYFDGNGNCAFDSIDVEQANVKVVLSNAGNVLEQVFTNIQGSYSFDTDSFGTYEVSLDTAGLPFSLLCPINNLHQDTVTALDSLHYSNDFALVCKAGFDVGVWSVNAVNIFRPANLTRVNVIAGDMANVYGASCASGVNGNVTVEFTGPISYLGPASGAITPTIVNANTLSWNVSDFGLIDFYNDFNIEVETDTTAIIGSMVCFTITVTPTIGDNIPNNNLLTQCFTVVGSYDPNDKQVSPIGAIDTSQEWLTYTIRFQNVGTAEAQHIYIDDTLDNNLDFSSFQLLAYSHDPLVQIKNNVVRFNFPNIDLPDSTTNEEESHGYVQYKVKLMPGLPIGTQINNTAYIYFDFNAPVVTNTISNVISLTNSIFRFEPETLNFHLYPNPTTGELSIDLGNTYKSVEINVSSIIGKVTQTQHFGRTNLVNFKIKGASGLYLVEVKTEDGNSAVLKVLKE